MSCKTKNSAYSNQDAVSQIRDIYAHVWRRVRFPYARTIKMEIYHSLVTRFAEFATNSKTSPFPSFFNQQVEFEKKYTYFTYEFIETRSFSQIVNEQLTAEEYRTLQLEWMATPLKGELIQNAGGARKIRVAKYGKGKRGGARVIYYVKNESRIWFLFLYVKSEKENLTRAECNAIHDVVKAIKE